MLWWLSLGKYFNKFSYVNQVGRSSLENSIWNSNIFSSVVFQSKK